LGLKLADLDEPVEVVGPVELVAARPFRRLEQAFAGVVPDRVDRDAGLVGQLVDAPPGFWSGFLALRVDTNDTESIYSQCSSTGRKDSRATPHR
jgi:hypothetical protein